MYRLLACFFVLTIVLSSLEYSKAATFASFKAIPRGGSEGKYVSDIDKWAYKPDNRGKYVHVHVPYDGGYGPFQNPYDHDDNPYNHIEEKYVDDPFRNNVYNDPKPAVYREYGAPLFNNF